MINKVINFQNHVFEQIETGHCKVPGTNYDYVGPIFFGNVNKSESGKRVKSNRDSLNTLKNKISRNQERGNGYAMLILLGHNLHPCSRNPTYITEFIL